MNIGYVLGQRKVSSSIERAVVASLIKGPRGVGMRPESIEEIVQRRWPSDRPALLIAKAAASPGATGSVGWGAEIAETITSDWLESLADNSAAAQFIPRGLIGQITDSNKKRYPYRSSASAPMAWVAENDPMPVTSYTLGGVTLTPKKMAAQVVVSREVTKASDAETIIGQLFREDAGHSLDAALFSEDNATATRHPGLLDGVSEFVAATDPLECLASLAGEVSRGGSGEVVFITSPERAARFSILHPQSKAEVLGSLALPADRIIALDPRALIHGFGPAPEIDMATAATLHMSDGPLPISSSGVADPVRSTWQTDCVSVRCVLTVAFAKRRSNAVAYTDSIGW